MEVDESNAELGLERILKSEAIFAKSEELQATFYAHIPAEVRLVFRNAGKYLNIHSLGQTCEMYDM